jgi:hypothetical protein
VQRSLFIVGFSIIASMTAVEQIAGREQRSVFLNILDAVEVL